MIVSRSRMMKMLRKSCFSVVSLDFHRFCRHVLARSTGNGRILFSFGDTYLHLPRDRVPESLWKPHQSKAINFMHRNYVPTFFPTPTKKYFFSGSKKIYVKKMSEKKTPKFFWKSKIWIKKKHKLINIFDFQKIFRFSFSGKNIFYIFFCCSKKIIFFRSWKKNWSIVSM